MKRKKIMKNTEKEKHKSTYNFKRRDFLKGLATVPVLGAFAGVTVADWISEGKKNKKILAEWAHLPDLQGAAINPSTTFTAKGDIIRIGVIGCGNRGMQLLQGLGFAHPSWLKENMRNGRYNKNAADFLDQDDLNVKITAVCDTFEIYAQRGKEAAANETGPGNAAGKPAKIKTYPTYREMLENGDVDAVVIATPDHWHARMAIDAVRAGKHVYCEKPMTRTENEAKAVYEAVTGSGVVFQLGHQNRQQASYIKAEEVVRKGVLGKISLVETFTNRNSDTGAWIRYIHPDSSERNVNWKEFLGGAPYVPFDPDRYFNWQKWFEYGTGVAGNQFTHEYDCVNQIMGIGIPRSVAALGGTYFYRGPRDIPDVFNAIFEYPDRGMALTYDCTLKNSWQRDKLFMGDDASMKVAVSLQVFPDRNSDKFKKLKFDPETPIFTFNPKIQEVDAVTSATASYYQERGFGYTYRDGKRIDCTYLHLKEWINAIRGQAKTSCNVKAGFEESMTFIMANRSYLEKRRVEFDETAQKIV